MPGSEQAALLPLPIVRDAIRPRSLPFDSDDSSLGCRFGRNQGRFRPNRQPCAPQQTNEPPSSPCDVYPDFSDVYMNSSGNTALSYKNGIHKSKRCYTPGFRRKPTCYFFANAVKRQTHRKGKCQTRGRRKRSPTNPQSKNLLHVKPTYTPTLALRSSKKQKRSGNEWHRRKASSSTRKFPGQKSVRAGHAARNRRDSAVYAVRQYIEVTRIRQPTTFRA